MFSDWLRWAWGCCRKCEERLTGGDGDAEWKEAELPKEPGMFTGAELCSKLPPAREARRVGREGEGPCGASRVGAAPSAPQPSTDCDAARGGNCAVIESLLQGSHPKLVQVQVVQGRL